MKNIAIERGTQLKTKYLEIAESLQKDIERGVYGNKLPGLRVLAHKYNVNLKTMAKASNTLVDRNILSRGSRGTGTCINRPQIEKRLFNVWLLSEKWSDELEGFGRTKMVRGANDGLRESSYRVRISLVEINNISTEAAKRAFEKGELNGIITTGIQLDRLDFVKSLKNAGIPCVSLHYRVEGLNYVDADNLNSAREAVEYLTGLGHRNIAILHGGVKNTNVRDNHTGYLQALENSGIKYCPEIDVQIESIRYNYVYNLVKDILGRKPEVTAFFTSGDTVAVPLVKALGEMNIRVPEDISVVGFDGLPISEYCSPSVTTVKQPFYESGRTAGQKLIELAENKISEISEILPSRLIIRESTTKCSK